MKRLGRLCDFEIDEAPYEKTVSSHQFDDKTKHLNQIDEIAYSLICQKIIKLMYSSAPITLSFTSN